MTKNEAARIAKIWNVMHAGCTPATMTRAKVETSDDVRYDVVIYPQGKDNVGNCFYHVNVLANVCAAFNKSCYITTLYGKKEIVVARIID